MILAFLAAALFGAATPASKWLLTDLTPFQLAGLLYLGAAVGVAPFAWRRNGFPMPWHMDRQNRRRLLGAVLTGGVLGPVLLLSSLRLASAASVSLWLNLELAATALFGFLLFRDHLGPSGWLGTVAALAAATLLSWETGPAGLHAGGLVLLACACWGLDNHLTALIDSISPSQTTFWKGLVAGSVNLTLGASMAPISVSPWAVVVALGVGIWSYGASIVLYVAAAQGIGATRAQIIFSSAPFFGVVLSVALLGESVEVLHFVAALLFGIAVALLLAESHAHSHTHEALTHTHVHRHDDGHHTHVHPGLPAWTRHTHLHEHTPVTHIHPHWPDIHHRHKHGASE
ncbi:MAG: EamA family transporter [Xenococcaceae cyanobacterium]